MKENLLYQFKKGALEFIVLGILDGQERYGYEIIGQLNAYKNILGEAKEGTLYPVLYRLSAEGLVAFRQAEKTGRGSPKKYYSLTDAGRAALKALKDFWFRFSDTVDNIMGIDRISMRIENIDNVDSLDNIENEAAFVNAENCVSDCGNIRKAAIVSVSAED